MFPRVAEKRSRCGQPPHTMYMLRQPATLEALAMQVLGRWSAARALTLVEQLQASRHRAACAGAAEPAALPTLAGPEPLSEEELQLVTRQMEHFQAHISVLHGELHNALLPELVRAMVASATLTSSRGWMQQVFRLMVESFFTSRLAVLTLDWMLYFNICFDILCAKSHMLSRLTRLDMRLYLVPPQSRSKKNQAALERNIIKILKELPALKHLSLTSFCTDNILTCVAEHCPLVEELDLSRAGSLVNDASMRVVARLKYLKKIYLRNNSVFQGGVEILVVNCEHLEHIEPSGFIAMSLGYSDVLRQRYAGKVLKLKSCDTGASYAVLEMLSEVCPRIQHMTLRRCERDARSNLPALAAFADMCRLELVGYKLYEDRVTETLRAVGGKLVVLYLDHMQQMDLDAVKVISQMCPHLQEVSIVRCEFLDRSSVREKLEILPFRGLKRLYWRTVNTACELPILLFILSNSLNVEYVKIVFYNNLFTDELLLKVLDRNPLRCLQEMTFYMQSGCVRWKPRGQVVSQHALDRIVRGGSRPLFAITTGSGYSYVGMRIHDY